MTNDIFPWVFNNHLDTVTFYSSVVTPIVPTTVSLQAFHGLYTCLGKFLSTKPHDLIMFPLQSLYQCQVRRALLNCICYCPLGLFPNRRLVESPGILLEIAGSEWGSSLNLNWHFHIKCCPCLLRGQRFEMFGSFMPRHPKQQASPWNVW